MYDRPVPTPTATPDRRVTSLAANPGLDSGVLARVGSVLGDVTRCGILTRLATGPAYPAELASELGTTRANLSNHLACLRVHGLVAATPEGRRVQYRIANPELVDALCALVAATREARPA